MGPTQKTRKRAPKKRPPKEKTIIDSYPKELRNIRGVFFDAGNTLFRPYPSVGTVYARLARNYGCSVSAQWVESRFKEEWTKRNGLSQLKTEKKEKEWWRNLVRDVFGKSFRNEKQFFAYYEHLYQEFAEPKTWRLYKDTLPALNLLQKKGYLMGIVSNWDSRLFHLCDELKVSPFMEFIMASAVEETVKPEKRFFRKGLKKTNLTPMEVIYIGDSYHEDYWGAEQAGIISFLLCRNGHFKKQTRCLKSLSELKALPSLKNTPS